MCVCLVAQSCLTLCNPMDCSPRGSSVHGDSLGKITGMGAMPSSRGSSQPRDPNPRSPALQEDSILFEPPGKPKNLRVSPGSLLQGIFLIQELNCGFLHCRWILYQLSYIGTTN